MTDKVRVPACLTALMFALFLSACAGTVKNMQTVPADRVVTTPDEGKALLVFMRPSTLGYAIQSSVFEIIDDKPSLVGIVAAKAKLSQQFEPGNHLFMVVGESADFMAAELAANKTYYALVTPRMGAWKARFSLKPVSAEELRSPKIGEWTGACQWVETTAESERWAAENIDSISQKQQKYYANWMEKAESERPRLLPQDGR